MDKKNKTPQGKASGAKNYGGFSLDSVPQLVEVESADSLVALETVDTVCAGERTYTLDEEANTLTVQYPQRAPKLLGTWMKVTHSILDEKGENRHIRVVFKDDEGREHGPLIISDDELTNGGKSVIARLVKANYRLGSVQTQGGYADLLNYLYLAKGEPATGVTETGWSCDGRAFVLPNDGRLEVLGSHDGKHLEYIGGLEGFPKFRRQGTREGWLKVIEPILKQSRLLSACAAWSLAPVLLEFAPIVEGGALYLWGGSGLGKTTAGKVALSLWGAVDGETDRASFRTTSNGLEAYLANHNGFVAVCDELGENNSPQDMEKLAYLFGNGNQKMRATVTGGLRNRREMKTFSLGCGEKSLEAFKGGRMDEGARQRMGEIHISDRKDDEGFTPGVFDPLPYDSPYRDRARKQHEAALDEWRKEGADESVKPVSVSPYAVLAAPLSTITDFGLVGPTYVEALVKSFESGGAKPWQLREEIERYIKEWCSRNQTKGGPSGTRFARRCALMAYAGEDALRKGVFRRVDGTEAFPEGWFSRAAAHVYSVWASDFRDAESNEQEIMNEFFEMLASRRSQFIEFVEDGQGGFRRAQGQGEVPDAFGAVVLGGEPQCGPQGRTCPPVKDYYLLAGSSGLKLATRNVLGMRVHEVASILRKHHRLIRNEKGNKYKFNGSDKPPFEGIESSRFIWVVAKDSPGS